MTLIFFLQVLIHSPHLKTTRQQTDGFGRTPEVSDISLLNINQQVISLATGRLDPEVPCDSLLVGTATNLMAYDVDNNTDLFYKEVLVLFNIFMYFLLKNEENTANLNSHTVYHLV